MFINPISSLSNNQCKKSYNNQNPAFGVNFVKEIKIPQKGFDVEDILYSIDSGDLKLNDKTVQDLDKAYLGCAKEYLRKMMLDIYEKFGLQAPRQAS